MATKALNDENATQILNDEWFQFLKDFQYIKERTLLQEIP